MSDSRVRDRKAVKTFFEFPLNQDGLRMRRVWIRFVLICAGVGLIGGIGCDLWRGSWPFWAVTATLVSVGIALGIDRALAKLSLIWRTKRKEENNRQFARLAEVVRRVQAEDSAKATLRIFERCQIDRSELRVLQHQYHERGESGLFDTETPRQILGDLYSKSSTFRSFPNREGDALRLVYWKELGRKEAFFNPARTVSLYLTNAQIVVCDVIVDSIRGDLHEDILRITFPDVVSVASSYHRSRQPVTFKSQKEIKMAYDHGLSEEELQLLRQRIADGSEEEEWVFESTSSFLKISRTDGGVQVLPIRYQTYFGAQKSALDSDSLTDDEQLIDRMVNELNRMIENSKRPGATVR